jgi:hypothetical protein
MRPFFLTGSNAKIIVNGVTLAYCNSVSYSVQVNHATPTILGMYEASSIEPLSYKVTGSFSVTRYVADVGSKTSGPSPQGVASGDQGNGIGTWAKKPGTLDRIKDGLSGSRDSADGRVYDSLNPSKLDQSTTFTMEIYQKISGGEQVAVAKIRDIRITQADFNLSNNKAAIQNFNFSALYADEDSFLADMSGEGQNFQ